MKTAARKTLVKKDEPHRVDASRWRALAVLCAAVVLSLTTWFSATAITPELQRAWSLTPTAVAWMTNGVQIGFVAGALLASLVNLPDIVRLNRLMAISAGLAAVANATLLAQGGAAAVVAARFVTGFALAGVYPPAMKLVATWFVRDRGIALGAVIGALTLGSALPHLFRALSDSVDWQLVVVLCTVATLVGAGLFWVATNEGPYPFPKAVFEPREIGLILRDKSLLLANLGYLGHMWELYAMWAWLIAFARASLEAQHLPSPALASAICFVAIAAGSLGCLLGGAVADRLGRPLTTAVILVLSASCAALIGLFYSGPLWLLVTIAVLWGVFVIADSAQFSAIVTEVCDRRFVGTALSVQMGLGFALTVVVIALVPRIAAVMGGWQWVFLCLVPGPLIGAACMLTLWRRQMREIAQNDS